MHSSTEAAFASAFQLLVLLQGASASSGKLVEGRGVGGAPVRALVLQLLLVLDTEALADPGFLNQHTGPVVVRRHVVTGLPLSVQLAVGQVLVRNGVASVGAVHIAVRRLRRSPVLLLQVVHEGVVHRRPLVLVLQLASLLRGSVASLPVVEVGLHHQKVIDPFIQNRQTVEHSLLCNLLVRS